jgi:hypothetical protein
VNGWMDGGGERVMVMVMVMMDDGCTLSVVVVE